MNAFELTIQAEGVVVNPVDPDTEPDEDEDTDDDEGEVALWLSG